MKRWGLLAEILNQDLRHSARALLKRPRLTTAAVLTLAVGIGATSAVFTVVNAVLLRPLPYEDPDRLVQIFMQSEERQLYRELGSAPNYRDWRERNETFEELGCYVRRNYNLVGGGLPERISGARATASLFPLLGVSPFLGRTFTPREEEEEEPVLILSYGLWQRNFGGDPQILGQTVTVDDVGHTVVGIMPPEYNVGEAEMWLPMVFSAKERDQRVRWFLSVLGRLNPGVTLAQAQEEMSAIGRDLEQEYGGFLVGWKVKVVSLNEKVVGEIRPTLLVLSAAVGFVLLLACANVSTLLLVRGNERQREVAIRLAMGGGRGYLISQGLIESLLLALAGGALGLLLAVMGTRWLTGLEVEIPRLEEIRIEPRVLIFTLGISLVTTLIFGLVPALRASRTDPNAELQGTGPRSTQTRQQRLRRNLLVIVQLALAVVLLVGAGLTMRSFRTLMQIDPGYEAAGVLTTELFLSEKKYPWPEEKIAFFQELLDRVQALPGVRSAGAAWSFPIGGGWHKQNYIIEGNEAYHQEFTTFTFIDTVTPEYFRTMGIPLLRGRTFTEQDREQPPIVIIDESMAERWWPGENPIGKRLAVRGVSFDYREVVGVVKTLKRDGLEVEAGVQSYVPYIQYPQTCMALFVRTESNPMALAGTLRELIRSIDPDLPMEEFTTMETRLGRSFSQRRFNMWMMGIFAIVALVLALVGIYGVVGYVIAQRTQEIGLRAALGARPAQVLGLFLGEGLWLTASGLLLGLAAAAALTRTMEGVLYGVRPLDPLTFAGAPAILAAVALLAVYVAARKATRVNPVSALRYE